MRRFRRDQISLLVTVVIAVPVVMWAGVRFAGQDDDRPVVVADDPGVSHVHGLGINPSDRSLIIATHFGSFRLPAGGDVATRIGDSFQDTMGFTVAGPDNFLGSGHPDLAAARSGTRSPTVQMTITRRVRRGRPLVLTPIGRVQRRDRARRWRM